VVPSFASEVERGNGPRVAARAKYWESGPGSARNPLSSLVREGPTSDQPPAPPDLAKMASTMSLSDDESDGGEDQEEDK
jgi:hypothetical protein